jgi:hypothetical protein
VCPYYRRYLVSFVYIRLLTRAAGFSTDPLLVWNYTVMAVFTGGGGCAFWLVMKRFDTQENEVTVDAGRAVGDDDKNL